MIFESLIGFIIIAIGIASGLISIHFLIRGLKEDKIMHTALAGNALIVASTISALCYAIIL